MRAIMPPQTRTTDRPARANGAASAAPWLHTQAKARTALLAAVPGAQAAHWKRKARGNKKANKRGQKKKDEKKREKKRFVQKQGVEQFWKNRKIYKDVHRYVSSSGKKKEQEEKTRAGSSKKRNICSPLGNTSYTTYPHDRANKGERIGEKLLQSEVCIMTLWAIVWTTWLLQGRRFACGETNETEENPEFWTYIRHVHLRWPYDDMHC